MKFGLTTSELNFILSTIVDPIKKQGAKVFCYGSRARGDYKKFSDLDLMVENGDEINLYELHEKVQESNFPYKVDIVHYKDFADAYKTGYEKDKIAL
jgi:uncharacterized protein